MRDVTRRRALCLAAGGVLALAGCSRSGKVEDFTPPADKARKALEAALNHWKGGHPPTGVPGTDPKVEVLDSKWKGGLQLRDFEILTEGPAGTGPRSFTVRLTPAKGPPQEVKYVVNGIDPVWVYRDEDFQKLSGSGM
jgi:hypothetical protein